MSVKCCNEKEREKRISETHIVLDRTEMMNTTAASSSRGVAAATTRTSSEREHFFLKD